MSKAPVFYASGALTAAQQAFVTETSATVAAAFDPATADPDAAHVFARASVQGYRACGDKAVLLADLSANVKTPADVPDKAADGKANMPVLSGEKKHKGKGS